MPRSPKAKKSEVKPYDHDSAGDDQSAAGVVADATTKPKPPRGGGPGKKWTPEDRAKVIKAVVKAANVDWKQISEEEFGGTRTASQVSRPNLTTATIC